MYTKILTISRRSELDISKVVNMALNGSTEAQIVADTGFNRQFVHRRIKRAESEVSLQDAPRSGRPCKLTRAQKKKLTACMVGKQLTVFFKKNSPSLFFLHLIQIRSFKCS